MKRTVAGLTTAFVLTGILLSMGCSKRDNPVMTVPVSSRTPYVSVVPFQSLEFNSLGDGISRFVSVAYASVDSLSAPQAPMPVLYLLHDFNGDGKYFGRYDLQGIMDDMFQKGEIGRMMVVTVGANNSFGGSYYRNSVTTGNYEDLLGETISYVERNYPVYTAGGKAARAISGHGMGGYGAIRYAMEHPTMFGAASSLSGPLSFDATWDGEPWLSRFADQIFSENGVSVGDSAGYAAMAPDSPAKLFTDRIFAMSAAFSPRQLDPFDRIDTCTYCPFIFGCSNPALLKKCYPCSVYAAIAVGKTSFTFPANPNGRRGTCSNPQEPLENAVDLPFTWTKARYDSIWNQWSQNDAKTYLAANTGVFSDMNVYLDCGVDDEFGYLYQNRDFVDELSAAGYQEGTDYFYEEYYGSPGIPAGHDDLIVERLRKILKFHSDRFARAPGSN